ncbi:M50 family metallopeptidase [Actinomadura madurae]|nr:M50 family metallopeptidase [Actinomadura madurae]MCP9948812.1 M50 family metallopeptidase [Actinomadura madurae]MCP9965591.1 M50 family metallopeptidase [Actinomadura madurae]MCQ0010422.1 M50 family metallopeptidase [Actinomadura madurae]URM94424.1 M50 family metallopeptidase [Actinomadura madurae]
MDVDNTSIADLWDRVTGTQPDPPLWLVALVGLVALGSVLHGPTWRVARNTVTIAHEGGHALIALVTGRKLDGIKLHSDTSGVTVSRGKPHGPGMIFTAMAGYLTPPLLGLFFALLLAAGRITLMLWFSLALLAAMLVMIRNAYGALSVIATGAIIFGVSWLGSAEVQAGFAYLAAWFLLLAATRPVIELQRMRARHMAPSSDADQLAHLTGVPGLAWVALFGATALLALLTGGALLVPDVSVPDLPTPPGFGGTG